MYASPENYIPQQVSLRHHLAIWLLVVLGSLTICAAIVSAPLALNSGPLLWALSIYRGFSLVCHQIPERSFFIAGHPFAVCARCFGLYAGFTLGTILYPLISSLKKTDAPPRKWLFVAAAPLLIDYSLEFFGIWHNTHSSRLLTGGLLGAVSVFYVMPGLIDLGLRLVGNQLTAGNAATPALQRFPPS